MNFHILTLFPDMVMDGLGASITGRAMDAGVIRVDAIDIREYSKDKHRHVDDAPYGGGAGMVMQPGPVCEAYEDLCGRMGKRPRLIYMTPQGRVFNQSIARELAGEEDLVFLCGHYEGIDERALELIATDYLSLGDYVLTGGELPAMVMIDCISRLIPGVLNNETSAQEESFCDNLLEYPQYTRPEVFRGMEVPEVLLSGHHKRIEEWRRMQSIKRTLERRPDLLADAGLTLKEARYLDSLREEEGCLDALEEMLDRYVSGLVSGAGAGRESGAGAGRESGAGNGRESGAGNGQENGGGAGQESVAAAGRMKRRAMSMVKKLLASKECTVKDLECFYKVCALKMKMDEENPS